MFADRAFLASTIFGNGTFKNCTDSRPACSSLTRLAKPSLSRASMVCVTVWTFLPLASIVSIFRAHQVEGVVTFEYDTLVYFGRLRTRGV